MGNTSSSPSGGTPSQSAPGSSTAPATSSSTTSQPIPTSSTTNSNSTTTVPPVAFHSGLTPPPRSPSPPCPPTPPLLPYGGHLSPQNPHALSLAQAHDYSKTVVTTLIMEARLAPFYRGLEDYDEDYTEESIGQLLNELREKDFEEGVANSVVEAMKAEREPASGIGSVTKKMGIHKNRENRVEEEKAERDKRERKAYLGAVECPICFLNYPSNINTSRCCQQPICTECFVQIKRSEATLTHLESEPACCPFCVETDFGVIYERPNLPSPLSSTSAIASQSALSISPEAGTSGLSQALNMDKEDAELSVGIGMAPKVQETIRRKSVSHKSKEVVTIDEIRPDWEDKLNAVKAAAARKASRRIVMRQVGDRLIPIGFTSARAPGQADFSMSTGAQGSGNDSGAGSPSRRDRRRGSGRERDLEELMIMEAMRLSLLDHEDHQRRQVTDDNTSANATSPISPTIPTTQRAPDKRKFSLTVPGQSGSGSSSRRASDAAVYEPKHQKSGSTAGKFFQKISGNRSRSGSTASSLKAVSFSPSTTHLPGPSRGSPVPSPRPTTPSPPIPVTNQPILPPLATPTTGRSPPPSSLSPTTAAPAIISLANHRSVQAPSPTPNSSDRFPAGPPPAPIGLPTPIDEESSSSSMPGLPRLSLDMPPLQPSPLGKTGANSATMHHERAPLTRNDTDVSDAPTERPSYARLDSDV